MAEARRQPQQEPESMGREDLAAREFMAGWFDGLFSAKASTTHRLRQFLERLALTLDDQGRICSLSPDTPRSRIEGLRIDNPEHDPDYERGWEQAFEQTNHLILKRLVPKLPEHGLSLVSKAGRPLLEEEVSQGQVDLYAVTIEATRPTRLPDASLHAALNHALEEAKPEPPAPSAQVSPQPRFQALKKIKGVLTMIHKHLDRRAAIISLSTVLACGALSYAFWPRAAAISVKKSRTTPGYVVPGWLNRMKPRAKAFLMSWDRVFYQVETQQPAPAPGTAAVTTPFNSMATLVLTTMTTPGYDQLKQLMAGFLASSHRSAYIPYLIPGADPANSSTKVRVAVVVALRTLEFNSGPSAFSTASRNVLLGFFQNENDVVVHRHLDTLLTALGVAH